MKGLVQMGRYAVGEDRETVARGLQAGSGVFPEGFLQAWGCGQISGLGVIGLGAAE